MSLVAILTSLVTGAIHSSLYTNEVSVWICPTFICWPTRRVSNGA